MKRRGQIPGIVSLRVVKSMRSICLPRRSRSAYNKNDFVCPGGGGRTARNLDRTFRGVVPVRVPLADHAALVVDHVLSAVLLSP
jgi:hypothetical protein